MGCERVWGFRLSRRGQMIRNHSLMILLPLREGMADGGGGRDRKAEIDLRAGFRRI